MAEFIYENPFQIEMDTTNYRLLTKDFVKTVEIEGKKILKVDPKGLELLAKTAVSDISFFLRTSHLEKLASILDDPEATDNDRFVAYVMLRNTVISSKEDLPWCQDTGTAIVIGRKGEQVWTGTNDAESLSRGIYETFKEKNLRYSQVVPFTMFDEKNTGTNLPAQIDIYSKEGNSYEFLFITKGGGSANKTFLYQQTKSLLNEDSMVKFVKEKIKELG
ncbi:MAG: fumarate hydratase, partial [Odoribacter sp.]|nr:fumarate hydratase [Odoribacter sp.]